MNIRSTCLALLCSASLLAGCRSASTEPFTALPRELSLAEIQLVSADNRFALKLFQEINTHQSGKNVFVSPLSVAFALGMTYNGAAGTTRTAMGKTLELEGLTIEQVNQSYRSIMDLLLNLDSKVQIQLGNAIWYRQGFTVEKDFVDLNKKYFDAEVSALNFGDPGAPGTMNQWVSSKTNGKIPTIVDFIDPSDVMFLVNAIYFKGAWAAKFDPQSTRDGAFHLADGSTKQVPMMQQEGEWSQFSGSGIRAIDLPYSRGAFSLTVLMPTGTETVEALIARVDQTLWNTITTGFHSGKTDLHFPKFKFEYDLGLNDALSALGMAVAFDAQAADFTGINRSGGLFISRVKHKSYVEVNEEGTEAAAATSVGVSVTSAPVPIVVDRPFVFAIREHFSGTILFLGKITDPTVSKGSL